MLTEQLDDTSPVFQFLSKDQTWTTNHSSGASDKAIKTQLTHQTMRQATTLTKPFTGHSPMYVSPIHTKCSRANECQGDAVSLTFNGTAIAIYGGKRGNHGTSQRRYSWGWLKDRNILCADGWRQHRLYVRLQRCRRVPSASLQRGRTLGSRRTHSRPDQFALTDQPAWQCDAAVVARYRFCGHYDGHHVRGVHHDVRRYVHGHHVYRDWGMERRTAQPCELL